MFFKKSNKIDSSIDTLIGANTVVSGDVTFSGGLRVDGTIRGNIQEQAGSQGTIILGESGRIEGSVTAASIVLLGAVTGSVNAGQFVELRGKASIKGDLHYTALEMQEGAVVNGKLVHNREAKETDEPQLKVSLIRAGELKES
ncbi:MAG: polymer-forming cytoskeletal protein [Methylophilaceae bacterium]